MVGDGDIGALLFSHHSFFDVSLFDSSISIFILYCSIIYFLCVVAEVQSKVKMATESQAHAQGLYAKLKQAMDEVRRLKDLGGGVDDKVNRYWIYIHMDISDNVNVDNSI